MEWTTTQHLDLRHVGPGLPPLQPHAAVFHPVQAVVAVAIGTYIIEFDALTGSKICSVDIGARVVRMSYMPTTGHAIISILEDCTIRSCDFDTEQTLVLHSPEKRMDRVSSETEVHLALTPLQPVVFFGFHKRMSVTVVGTIEGGRAPTKIKTDLKKPIVNLACHPRLPVLYVAYADGLIRAYNIQTYAVQYTLQLDPTIKLIGAGAFAFHPTLEWIFIGDRKGTLLAWDVSTERPSMIGITQAGTQEIISVAWLPTLRLLVTVTKDGSLQVWKTCVVVNPNRQPMQTNFFEHAAVESIDIPQILSLQDGESAYPLPCIKNIAIHPKLNLAALLFADVAAGDSLKRRSAYSREGRKQLFAVLQGARGSSASILKEKLLSLGSSGILADHQLQTQLQEYQSKGQSELTISDVARKAFLYSHFMEGHAKSGPITRLPLLTISDTNDSLMDVPVCQPFHLELNFFNKENRVVQYPVRAFYLDEVNLMSYNLSTGMDNLYKKLYHMVPANVDFHPKSIVYSSKQHMFLVVYQISNSNSSIHEVVLYREQTDKQSVNSKVATIKGRDAALIGTEENQYAILDDDKSAVVLYSLAIAVVQEVTDNNGAIDRNSVSDEHAPRERGPLQFSFKNQVDRIFSSPLESTILYAINGNHIGFAKLIPGYRLTSDGNEYISNKMDGNKSIKLKLNEIALQVQWQETLRGHVAGILTSQRVLIVSKDLDILSSSSTKFDKGLPSFRSLLWVGPALLFSSASAICMLGWDDKVRSILSISMPCSSMLGVLNDRILLANTADINPRQKKGVEIRSCLIGLLEPLLIGFATMQQQFEQKLDLSEILYQITSRFDSLRITPRSLDILAKGSPVCGDLAVSLSQAGPHFTQMIRCTYAIKAQRFSTALSVLKDEFLRSRDYPQCPPTSQLFHRFRQLGYACIKYGQFDSAKETFETISDFQSMLDLFVCHLNPSAMRRLAQKLEELSTDSELRRYCERILRIRSSGWTQGIFSNFAAESMVPKGPEWGGGNWEIKTPANLKNIPQWELAGEVMPYMKTSEGGIPSITAEHIGVYLGAIKGRGSVVEVSEKSLVRTFMAPNGENKVGMLPSSLQNSASAKVKQAMSSETKGDSVLDTLTKQLAGTTAMGDEQSKAAEDFQKSMYSTANGSSSDEDESTSKNKKIHIKIREKPVAAPTVDVSKIKEATRQLKLPEAPMRTRSSSGGSQDLSLIFSQPSSAANVVTNESISSNTFGTGVSSHEPEIQTPPVTGMGVTAGPIPEDFFQNTVSSIDVAASLPTPPPYINRAHQANPVAEESKIVSDQTGKVLADFGLTDGGVPPQATQPQPVPLDSVGLPGGGVPPQQEVQVSQPPGPSQPLDLSSLEAPGSNTAPPRPSAVHPGQVPRGVSASVCFKTGLGHLEQNQLADALSCLDEAFLALAKDHSCGADIKAQATICAQYKIAVAILQEITRLQKVQGPSAISAKDEMARLSRHLASLPLLAKHRINCIRTSIKRNMEVQNYSYAKEMLELLLSKAPPGKQDELRSLVDICMQRGLSNKSIDPLEDPSQFCAATLSRLSTIGYDICDLCEAKFSALASPGCIICGMGSIKRSDSSAVPVPSPFG